MNFSPLIVISGPSGSGKTTIMEKVSARMPELARVVTTTTRAPRTGERDGVDYHFVDVETFQHMIDDGAFFEWAEVYGNYYGPTKADVERIQQQDKIPYLIIDVQGAMTVKQEHPNAYLIFIRPTPHDAYLARVRRERASEDNLEERIATIERELAQAETYDVVVENLEGAMERAVDAMVDALRTHIGAS